MEDDDDFEALRRDPGAIVLDGTDIYTKAQAGSETQTKDEEMLMINGLSLEDDMSIEDGSIYQDHPMNRLWKFCDSVDSSVKLLLPDSKSVPYYLKKPRNSKEKSQQALEREQRVFNLAIQKEVDEQRGRKTINSQLPKTSTLSIREERVGRDLLLQYQRDPEKVLDLLKKLEIQKGERRKRARQIKLLQTTTSNKNSPRIDSNPEDEDASEEQDQFPQMNVSTVMGRMERVLCRRSTLLKEHEKELKNAVDKWQNRVNNMDGHRKSSISGITEIRKATPLVVIERQDRWVNLVFGLRVMKKMKEIVDEARKAKEYERRRWFAVRLLQRFVRKARRARRRRHLASLGINVDDESVLLTSVNESNTAVPLLRRSVAGPEELLLYHRRVESASLVVTFLKVCSKQYRSIMHSYFRKVLVIQRRARRHFLVNEGRLLLVNTFFDKVFPAFFAYLTMVLSGKGNDLKNLTSLDLSRLRIHIRNMKNHHIVAQFDSSTFHAFLRENKARFQQTGRFLGPNRNALSNQMVNIERIKRHVFLSLIFRKRYQFATRLESVKAVAIPVQTITRSDVLAFIRGERDPVVDYVQEIIRIEDNHRAQYWAKKEASKHGRVYRKVTGKEVFLCMLSKITAEEFAMAVLNITEIALMEFDKQTATPAQSAPASALGSSRSAAGKASSSSASPAKPAHVNTTSANNTGPARGRVFGYNHSVLEMFANRTPDSHPNNHNPILSLGGSRDQYDNGGGFPSAASSSDDRSSASLLNKNGEDTADMKRLIQETARRVEATALTQQRQELVQATRRNSTMVGAMRRNSVVMSIGGANQADNSVSAAVATATAIFNNNNNNHNNRPGRRLSQMAVNSNSTAPKPPDGTTRPSTLFTGEQQRSL